MPESVQSRPTRSHEYIFLLSKSEQYYYDQDAIREPHSEKTIWTYPQPDKAARAGNTSNGTGASSLRTENPAGRNKRTVWTVATQPYAGAHFATFPEKLIEPCILAGSSPRACEVCNAPWRRLVERTDGPDTTAKGSYFDKGKTGVNGLGRVQVGERYIKREAGWKPSCACPNQDTGKSIVLDPFAGSGTTGRVALKHGRAAILCELNPAYVEEQIAARTNGVQVSLESLL